MELDTVVRSAIRRAPCSIRALARTAGVSHVFLQGIVTKRERATPRVALLVANALDTWSNRCGMEAKHVRLAVKSLRTESGNRTMSTPLATLRLTQEQAERLLALLSVGELAVNWKLQPAKPDDTRLFNVYAEGARANVSLERPLADLRKWLRDQERGKR